MKILRRFILLSVLCSLVTAQAYTNSCGNGGQNGGCNGNAGSGDGAPPSGVGANPINPQKGCLLRHITDLQTFGAAPIIFSRFYNSRTRDYTKPRWELGTTYTWQHNWQYEVRGVLHD